LCPQCSKVVRDAERFALIWCNGVAKKSLFGPWFAAESAKNGRGMVPAFQGPTRIVL